MKVVRHFQKDFKMKINFLSAEKIKINDPRPKNILKREQKLF